MTKPLAYPGDPRGYIDAPTEGATVTGTTTLSGWAFNRNATDQSTGVDQIKVYLDGGPGTGTLLGLAQLADSRPDVGAYFNDPRENTSGWHFDWSVSGTPAGTHTLYVVVHSAVQGTTVTLTRTVVVPSARSTDPLNSAQSSRQAALAASAPVTTWSYTYDGDGLLRSRSDGTTTTTYIWDVSVSPARLVRTVTGAQSTRIVYGNAPLYLAFADGSYRALARDGLGSVRAEVDASGTSLGAIDYTAYGQLRSGAQPTLLGFAGELQDVTGLTYLRSRWYDEAGRFITRDPIAVASLKPLTMNGFVYADGCPLTKVDPRGLFAGGATSASGATTCQKPDALTVGVGLVFGTALVVGGIATAAAGVALAAGGLAEAGATGGAGIIVTLEALDLGAEVAQAGILTALSGVLLFNASVVPAIQCGVR